MEDSDFKLSMAKTSMLAFPMVCFSVIVQLAFQTFYDGNLHWVFVFLTSFDDLDLSW